MTKYMHSTEYLKQRKDGTVERRPDGRYYLTGTEDVIVVNDGCPTAGVHATLPEQKPIHAAPGSGEAREDGLGD